MKNVNKISLLLAAVICFASCGNNQVEETSDPLINVTKEGLGYEVSGTSYEEEITSAETTDTTTVETTTISETIDTTHTDITTTVSTSADVTTTQSVGGGDYISQQYESIYNTTVEKNLDNVRFGDIKFSYFKDGYARFDANDYFGDIDFSNPTEEDIKKIEKINIDYTRPFEISTIISFGKENYDKWHYALAHFGEGNDRLNVSAAIVTHRDEENRKDVTDEYDINVVKDENNEYEFKFKGAGHYYYSISDIEVPDFYLETEQNGYIIDPQKIRGLILDEGEYISLKAFAVKLGDIEKVTSEGYAKLEPQNLYWTFLAKTENEMYDIELGMPYSKLVEMIGEGEVLKETIKSDNNEDDVINEYHVYKTTDYTLVVQKTEYPDIKRPMFYDDNLPDKVELVSTIILIDNVTTPFDKPVEETTTETSAATTVATEDTTTTKIEGEESNADTTTTVTA